MASPYPQNALTIYFIIIGNRRIINMNIRKGRIPLQGVSNFRATESDWKLKLKNTWSYIESCKAKRDQYSERPASKQTKLPIRIKSRAETNAPSSSKQNSTLSQIRKAYKNKSNIWRIAKAWKFANRGYITCEEFKQKIGQVIKTDVSQDQVQSIIDRYASNGKIDIKSFFKVIYGEDQNFTFNPRLFQVGDNEGIGELERKIQDLIDGLDIYEHAFRKDGHHHSQSNIKQVRLKNQKATTRKLDHEPAVDFSKEQFYRLTQQSFGRLRHASKVTHLHPHSMLASNQSKTRFGATTSNFLQEASLIGPQTQKNLQKSQSSQLLNNLANVQKCQKKLKLQRKIEKIREMHKTEKENIQRIEEKQAEKEGARLLRKRMDREAYQYAAYIKNKWE